MTKIYPNLNNEFFNGPLRKIKKDNKYFFKYNLSIEKIIINSFKRLWIFMKKEFASNNINKL